MEKYILKMKGDKAMRNNTPKGFQLQRTRKDQHTKNKKT